MWHLGRFLYQNHVESTQNAQFFNINCSHYKWFSCHVNHTNNVLYFDSVSHLQWCSWIENLPILPEKKVEVSVEISHVKCGFHVKRIISIEYSMFILFSLWSDVLDLKTITSLKRMLKFQSSEEHLVKSSVECQAPL